MMLGCEKTRIRLDGWLDGLLTEDALAEVNDHLAFCEECRDRFSRQLALQDDLATLGQVADRIADSPKLRVSRRTWLRPVRAIAIAACLALVAVSGYMVFERSQSGGESAPGIVRQDPVEPEERLVALGDLMIGPGDARRVRIENTEGCVAVKVKSADPKVHIVWLYGECASGAVPEREWPRPSKKQS